jgi:putative methionine-R-sulfoxide reductase with GAF domain
MTQSRVLDELKGILRQAGSREARAKRIAEVIRASGPYRWVGIYDVNIAGGLVSNLAWSGLGAPAYPTFPITKGLTSRAIASRKAINVGNVANESAYLTALGSTQSEIIVPILDNMGQNVLGTIDIESEKRDAFDKETEQLLEQYAEVLRPLWATEFVAQEPR